MKLSYDKFKSLLRAATEHPTVHPTSITLVGYVKGDSSIGTYTLVPVHYGDVLDRILAMTADNYLQRFRATGWTRFTVDEIRAKLDIMHASRQAFNEAKSERKGNPMAHLGLGLYVPTGSKDSLVIKEVIATSPKKENPSLHTAIYLAAVGGYIASFVLQEGNFQSITFEFNEPPVS